MTTSFLDKTPELFQFAPRRDRATKLLTYLGDAIVNRNPEVAGKPKPRAHRNPRRSRRTIPVPRRPAHASFWIN